ncbi:uncharacterized protein C6orf136 homolog isoform X2 [Ooceraea biroi]|uniref:uncharacterized protein C6orf136 homolog isoform X2 n=1 Tax=Ooceraea biroi TaxID=2015173 RepID=UPI0009716A83|nr:uncharacterized protein C6orf136 homolog isoform X2 [Ooceraea biroi]
MSLCFRSLPSRLSSLVSGRKPLSKLDHHHLQKHVSSSAFLKQTQSVEGDKNTMFLDNSRLISSGSLHNSRESNSSGILFTSNNTSILKAGSQSSSPSPQDDDKPSQDKLQHVVDGLTIDLTNLFTKPQNYTMYTKNMVFVNNIRGVTTVGVGNYAKQMILLRMIGHLKFAYVKCDIVKITMHPEDGTIKVRWRIRGVTGFRMFFSFWKYKIWKIRDAIDKDHELWYDGFSTYYVNGEGKIYKHIADKMMPDQDVTKKEDLRIAAKLALFASLANMFDSDNFSKLNSNLKLH